MRKVKNIRHYLTAPYEYWSGLHLYRKKQWKSALGLFQAGYEKSPNNALNTFKLGLCYLKLKDLHNAYYYINKGVELAKHNTKWKKQLAQCLRQLENSPDSYISSEKHRVQRINQGGYTNSLNISLRKKLLLIPSDYNHRVMADISSFISYYKDSFDIYIILRDLDSDIIYKSTHTLIKNGTSYGEYLKFIADYVIDAGTMNFSYRITDTTKWVSVWHGIPYKKMFVDLDIKHLNTAIRYGLAYDTMISMSDFYTDVFLRKAMNYQGEILKLGCAKADNLFEKDNNYIENIRRNLAIPNDKKIVLYAPEFKYSGRFTLPFSAEKLLNQLGNEYYLVVLLPSQYSIAPTPPEKNVFYISELNELDALSISDILISDYNSLIYKFDQYDKPVVLFHQDFENFLLENKTRYIQLNTLAKRPLACQNEDKLLSLDWEEIKNKAKSAHLGEDFKVNYLKKILGIPLHKKVILYAPTFRKPGAMELPFDPNTLLNRLDDEYIIITKLHYLNNLQQYYPNVIDLTSYSDLADLMKVSDMLISDYSSLVLDYALLNKPIVLFQYDYEEYMKQRGVYFDFEDYLPKKHLIKSEKELYQLDFSSLDNNHKRIVDTFYPLEDGQSTERIVNAINFIPEVRSSKDIIFLVNELNQIGGVHSFLKNMAKYYKEKYNSRIIVLAIKEFAESNSELHLLNSPYIDIKISSQYLNGACTTILKNTDGIVISLQFSAHMHFQKHLYNAKSVLMFHGDVKDMISKELYKWHLEAINSGKLYNYQKLLLLTESAVELLKPYLNEKLYPKLGYMHNSIDAEFKCLPHTETTSVAVISRLDEDKNIFALIELGKSILENNQDITINIYGDGGLRTAFVNEIEKYHLENVLKLRGFESNKEKIFSENNALISVSKSEGFPLVILEAYAYGRPVILFNTFTAAKDVVIDGKTGFLLPYGDYLGMIQAVKNVQNIAKQDIKDLFNTFSNEYVFTQWDHLMSELDRLVEEQDNQ